MHGMAIALEGNAHLDLVSIDLKGIREMAKPWKNPRFPVACQFLLELSPGMSCASYIEALGTVSCCAHDASSGRSASALVKAPKSANRGLTVRHSRLDGSRVRASPINTATAPEPFCKKRAS
ncbi:unnamed protein product [Polarella glacialis]|uniref:Uncharacterized protein n=1 Tax=Polarella glacialis TaxID=89957 RepID=A0A813IN43_POLGL|nr:unnamed protein product [Polarella glacialis]